MMRSVRFKIRRIQPPEGNNSGQNTYSGGNKQRENKRFGNKPPQEQDHRRRLRSQLVLPYPACGKSLSI